MPRRNTEFRAGEFYHVYNRGVDRQRIFFNRENYLHFLRLVRKHILAEDLPHGSGTNANTRTPDAPQSRALQRTTPKQVAEVSTYCLMPNHFHLLWLLDDDLPGAMQRLQMAFTKAVNKRFDRTGPLFQGRFQAVHVDGTAYLIHLSRYVHLNPVFAQLCGRAEEWEYSSYQEYIGTRDGTLPQTDRLLCEFDSQDAYRDFVEAGVGNPDRLIEHLVLE